jgi:hypothetical protein
MASSPQFVSAPNVGLTKFVAADGTTIKTIFSPGAGGSRIFSLFATSDDTAALQFAIYLVKATVRYKLDVFTLPAATSVTPTTNWNILDIEWFTWLDQQEPNLMLPSGVTLEVGPLAAVTSGKEVSLVVMGGDF